MLARKPTQIFKADEFPTVGAGLPAMAVVQWAKLFLIDRYRRQASSHQGLGPASRLWSMHYFSAQKQP
ncbi:hypothetical protein DBR46_23820 [Pseudomonas sp. KBW05]|nr:hypothetical protein DBR46_23820 [Pseudomonas sp. KBW05]